MFFHFFIKKLVFHAAILSCAIVKTTKEVCKVPIEISTDCRHH